MVQQQITGIDIFYRTVELSADCIESNVSLYRSALLKIMWEARESVSNCIQYIMYKASCGDGRYLLKG